MAARSANCQKSSWPCGFDTNDGIHLLPHESGEVKLLGYPIRLRLSYGVKDFILYRERVTREYHRFSDLPLFWVGTEQIIAG